MKKLLFTLSLILTFNAFADQFPSCGENCTYTLKENGTDKNGNTAYLLTIEPIDATKSATMKSYSRYGYPQTGTDYAPWRFDNVTEVVVKEGIETIEYGCFSDMYGITKVTLSEGLKTLGGLALNGTSITSINLPSTLTSIGAWGLATSTLQEINEIPSAVQSIDQYAFSLNQMSDLVISPNVKMLSPYAFGTSSIPINNLYCEKSIANRCAEAIQNVSETAQVKSYEFENGVYILKDDEGNETYYLSGNNMKNGENAAPEDKAQYTCQNLNSCKAEVLKNEGICDIEECNALVASANDGKLLKVGSKTYQSLDALLKGNYDKRRIYTIEEANFVAGDKNRVSITYR